MRKNYPVTETLNDESQRGVFDRYEVEVDDEFIGFEVESTDERAPYDEAAAAVGLAIDWDAMTATVVWTTVRDYSTGEAIGAATIEQIAASGTAPNGVITIDADSGRVLRPGADRAVWPNQREIYID